MIVENADKAIDEACRLTGAKVTEYTAAPVYFGDFSNGAHEWLIEFEMMPDSGDLDEFAHILDEILKRLNSDYEAKRSYNLSLNMPIIRAMEKDTFYNWLKSRGRIGGQNKVPKLSNNRKYVDSIMEFAASKS